MSSAAAASDHLPLFGPAMAGFFGMPIETPGALTDPYEGSLGVNSQDQEVVAKGIADAVRQYFSPPAPATTSTSAPTTTAAGAPPVGARPVKRSGGLAVIPTSVVDSPGPHTR